VSQTAPKAVEEYTPLDEYYLGRAVAALILQRYKLLSPDPGTIAYLNKICATIVINSSVPDLYNGYHLAVLDSPELNAFATSGGHIFLCRGLIEALDSEDALAAVIAHEIAHIQLKHSTAIITTAKRPEEFPGASGGDPFWEQGRLFDDSVWEMADALLINGYSQTQEFEADTYALSLLASAGYSPYGLLDALGVLENDPNLKGLNSTHPPAAIRIAQIQAPLRSLLKQHIPDTRSFRTTRYATQFKKQHQERKSKEY
jgi:predicted Zn-dependent protease